MAKVFIVQENPNVNVLAAGRYGELIALLRPYKQITFSSGPVVRLMKQKLKDFNDSDFLLAMGDPVAIAIASIVASDINNGRLKILKWDREHRAYYPVEIDIYNNRKENEDYVG